MRLPAPTCPRCDRPLRRTARGKPRKLRCRRCDYLIYDYPRSAAGVLVLRGREVLLLRRAHPPRIGCVDIPGGFIDSGETIEHAARRELREETGLRVGRLEPLGFYWDRYYLRGFGYFPTMNFYYWGRYRGGVARASDDAASAEWVRPARARGRHAWKHMAAVFHDLERVVNGRRPRAPSERW
jgi:ADP-ribose pyrophosphatase YjhB (NUDIX family)